MKGAPKVLRLSKIISGNGSSLTQLSVLNCVETLAPLVEAVDAPRERPWATRRHQHPR